MCLGKLRIREVDPCLKIFGHALMISEFAVITACDSMHTGIVRPRAKFDGLASGPDPVLGYCWATVYCAFRSTHDQGVTMTYTDYGITALVAETSPDIHDGRTIIGCNRKPAETLERAI